MKTAIAPLSTDTSSLARPIRPEDREQISNLIFYETHVHKHLDWKAPMEWLGREPFFVLQEGQRLSGALACPPDPQSVAWVRLFVFGAHLDGADAWAMMWPGVQQQLVAQGGATAAAIAVQRWLDPILLANGFELVDHIVLLELNTETAIAANAVPGRTIRPMTARDLPHVVELDAAAFDPLWQNSLEALSHGFGQSSYASVAEGAAGLIGYQLSTAGAFGTHLARLAVHPTAQRRGLGAALIHDLIAHLPAGRDPRLTVNTQASNTASHALYSRLGFRRTGERFPVFALKVPAAGAAAPNSGGLD